MLTYLVYLALGAVAGIIAGLLGVGGGIVIVPMLDISFAIQNLPQQYIQHLAVGTSLGTIIFTSISSFLAHHKRGAVNWQVVVRITPGILVGTYVGSVVASYLSTNFLKGFFIVFLYYVATQMLLNIKPKPTRQLPLWAGMTGVGFAIGMVSSFAGIGGGTMTVPFLVWCNIAMHTAIGTSAAIGLPIALAGTLGYLLNGLKVAEALPAGAIGFIYLPALVGISAASIFTAPLGAKIAHKLDVPKLKKIFAILLFFLATRMLYRLLF